MLPFAVRRNEILGLMLARHNAKGYLKRIEEVCGAPIAIVSTGPDRVETIVLQHPFTN